MYRRLIHQCPLLPRQPRGSIPDARIETLGRPSPDQNPQKSNVQYRLLNLIGILLYQ